MTPSTKTLFAILNQTQQKTGFVGSPIGSEIDLTDEEQQDKLHFLVQFGSMCFNEGVAQAFVEMPIPDVRPVVEVANMDQNQAHELLKAIACRDSGERTSGTTTRLAFAYALQALMFPGQHVITKDHHNQNVAHCEVTSMVSHLLKSLNVPHSVTADSVAVHGIQKS